MLGSAPTWLLAPIAFVCLVVVRCASLLRKEKPVVQPSRRKRKVVRLDKAQTVTSTALETMWALGTSVLGGSLPLRP